MLAGILIAFSLERMYTWILAKKLIETLFLNEATLNTVNQTKNTNVGFNK
jgi:hypothetical protein